jgi:hypothetical protein
MVFNAVFFFDLRTTWRQRRVRGMTATGNSVAPLFRRNKQRRAEQKKMFALHTKETRARRRLVLKQISRRSFAALLKFLLLERATAIVVRKAPIKCD